MVSRGAPVLSTPDLGTPAADDPAKGGADSYKVPEGTDRPPSPPDLESAEPGTRQEFWSPKASHEHHPESPGHSLCSLSIVT